MELIFVLIAGGITAGLWYVVFPDVAGIFRGQFRYGGWGSTLRLQYIDLDHDTYLDPDTIRSAAWAAHGRYLMWLAPGSREHVMSRISKDKVSVTRLSAETWRI